MAAHHLQKMHQKSQVDAFLQNTLWVKVVVAQKVQPGLNKCVPWVIQRRQLKAVFGAEEQKKFCPWRRFSWNIDPEDLSLRPNPRLIVTADRSFL